MSIQPGQRVEPGDEVVRDGRRPLLPQQRHRRPRSLDTAGFGRSSSVIGLSAKLLLIGLIDALAVYGLIVLAGRHSWPAFVAMLVGAAVVTYVFLSPRHVPAKYLVPGTIFLLVYQVFVVLYTGYTAFTNYGDGHNGTKSAAISTILQSHEDRVPDSPSYRLTVLQKDGALAFLVTSKQGQVLVGGPDDPLHAVADATKDSTGKATGLPGYRSLSFADLVARQQQVTTLRVPFAKATDGSLRTPDGSTAYVYRSTLAYDAASNTFRDTASGPVGSTVYHDNGKGYFVDAAGRELTPGWKVVVGWSNFTKIFAESDIRDPFLGVLVWTFAFAFLSVLTTFALGLALALLLNKPGMRGQRAYRSLLLIPYAVPGFLSGLVWAGLLNTDFGFVNQIALGGAHVPWLTAPWLARISVLLVNLWLGFPYMFLISTGALQAIPAELTEAARVDGAGPWRVLRSVKLPMLLVAVGPLLIASFAFNFNNFTTIYMVTGGGPKDLSAPIDVGSTDLLITMVYKLAFGSSQGRMYGFASAVSILIFVIVGTISAISFRRTKALEEIA